VVLAYVVSAVLAALVGILLSARIGSGQANIGAELTLQSIAAAVIAGVSLRGGIGDVRRVVVSVLFLAVLGVVATGVKLDQANPAASAFSAAAGEIGLQGTPIFTFQEGNDGTAARAFQEMAKPSRGA